MNPSRATAPVILAVATLTPLPQNVAMAGDTGGVANKIQIGGHLLTQDTGIVSLGVPDSLEDSGGVVGNYTILGKDRGRTPHGICLEFDGNRVEVGPAVPGVGTQTFGIATIRIMALMEVRLRGPQREPRESWQPYLSVGAGWNFHSVGTKISWPVLPPPEGTPLSLDLDGSPAVRVGVGFHSRGTEDGLSVNLEGGWKWDSGDFRMRVQDRPDRRGDYDLSGAFVLIGITLRP